MLNEVLSTPVETSFMNEKQLLESLKSEIALFQFNQLKRNGELQDKLAILSNELKTATLVINAHTLEIQKIKEHRHEITYTEPKQKEWWDKLFK